LFEHEIKEDKSEVSVRPTCLIVCPLRCQ